jgi:hypothetical protein
MESSRLIKKATVILHRAQGGTGVMDLPDGPEFSVERMGEMVRLALDGRWTVDASAAIEARADVLVTECSRAQ